MATNAALATLDHIWNILHPLGYPLALMGGISLVAGRLIDRADAAILLRENRDAIHLQYLNNWVASLGLAAEFAEIWQEAFPGESSPPAAMGRH
jgi:hypothetical protein